MFVASFPRSGNHWARHILEAVTGIATGSVRPLAYPTKPYEWGGYAQLGGATGSGRMPQVGDTVILMTHFIQGVRPVIYDAPKGARVVLIVRFPFDSIRSNYFLKHEGAGTADWHQFVRKKAQEWKKFVQYWESQPNVVTIRYEDLMHDPPYWSAVLCEAYGIDATEDSIARAVGKYPPQGTIGKHLVHYTEQDRADIVEIISKDLLSKHGYLELLDG